MTNAELIAKIRAEIERRRLHFNKEAEKYQALNNGYSQNCYGARDALRDLENFLSTLESEKQMNPTFQEQPVMDFPTTDEEMQHFLATHKPVQVPEKYKTADWIFKEQPVSEELEEAALEYETDNTIQTYDGGGLSPMAVVGLAEAFEAGAEWMKDKDKTLIKEAHDFGFGAGSEWQKEQDDKYVDTIYQQGIEKGKDEMKEQMMKEAVEGFIFQSEDYYPKELVARYDGELKHGDKVKLIIIKED